jgi:hypothetical protein
LLTEILTEGSKESQKDNDGVNNFQLISAGVMSFLIPIQHFLMGLVDKLLTSFLDYVWQKFLLLPLEDDLVQIELQEMGNQLSSLINLLQSRKAVYETSKTPENKELK